VLFGEDDRHLDDRVSLLAQDGQATLSTAVRFHGFVCRVYFFLVRPFQWMLARAGCRPRPIAAGSAYRVSRA